MSTKSGVAGPAMRLEFRYDYMGRRIRKNVYNAITGGTLQESRVFLYEGWNLVAEFDGSQSNALLRTYTWGLDLSGSRHGAGGTGGLLIVQDHEGGNPENHFAAYDGNGNVVGLIHSVTGEKSATYEYSPFGELIRVSGEMGMKKPIRYSSRYTDDETGLLYYGYRYYSPALGKWLSADPIEESGGMNVFGFLGNDPVNGVDVLGMFGSGGGNWWPGPTPATPDPKPERDPRYHDYQWGEMGGILRDPELEIQLIEAAEAATKLAIDLLIGYETVQAIQRGDVLEAACLLGTEFAVGKIFMAFKIGKAIGSFFNWCCKKAFLKATKAVIERVKSVGSKKACPNAAKGGINYGQLDSLGRPTGVTATITQDMIGTGSPPLRSIIPPGFQGGAAGQARGHLLGNQLGGSGAEVRNLVTLQQTPANSPVMRRFENQIRAAVEGGQVFNGSFTPVYLGDNLVPRGITITGQGSGGFNIGVSVLNPFGL